MMRGHESRRISNTADLRKPLSIQTDNQDSIDSASDADSEYVTCVPSPHTFSLSSLRRDTLSGRGFAVLGGAATGDARGCAKKVDFAAFRKTCLKKAQLTYWVLGWVFRIFFYLNEHLGSLLFDLAHRLSFSSDLPVLIDLLKICKFITCWSLEAVNIKKSLIITGMTNWNWIKFGAGFLLVQWVLPGVLAGILPVLYCNDLPTFCDPCHPDQSSSHSPEFFSDALSSLSFSPSTANVFTAGWKRSFSRSPFNRRLLVPPTTKCLHRLKSFVSHKEGICVCSDGYRRQCVKVRRRHQQWTMLMHWTH